ncbi:Trans-aconitate 2-methyltransferase [Chaetomidium leptoderma]|uniref:Trans-aconitate 2-methyltransferase n=1 Tax=Chaetomidium leptoderma TaxID=669021 RepID=A0AAN6VKE8_9PEZI|nr:Trans-aconitate 2-methyltransferase [Chaetomidium leptoderma]
MQEPAELLPASGGTPAAKDTTSFDQTADAAPGTATIEADEEAAPMAAARPFNQEVYTENGRWYGTYKKGKYLFPIDETELERLDMFHQIFLVARSDVLHSAPICNQKSPRILDLGCGTGIWGIDMADKYPDGIHIGLDLNYIQPEFIPANLSFLQQDIEDSISNWPKVYAETFRHLKPHNGYIEQVEIDWTPRCDDGTLPRNTHIVQWANQLLDVIDTLDRSIHLDSNLTRQRLADASFVDIKEEVIRLPLTGKGKDVGRWFNLSIRQACQPLSLAPLVRGDSWTPDKIHDLSEKVRVEIYNNTTHAYYIL